MDCTPAASIEPICHLANPEDLAWLRDSDWLLVSQMRVDGRGGSVAALSMSGGEARTLFPSASRETPDSPPGWSSADCPGPPDPSSFAPHGLDLGEERDGSSPLFVVNHGGRESVEILEIASTSPPSLRWRGCVPLPGLAQANDVAALPEGGFVVTNMTPRTGPLGAPWITLRLLAGWNTGYVLEWHPSRGWRQIPNSKASFPNGIATSPDGATLYVAAFGSGEIIRIRRADGANRIAVPLPRPDNLTWAADGRLLAAAHTAPLGEIFGCLRVDPGTCGAAFAVYAVNPATLETQLLFEHARGAPMGAGTVAVQVRDALFVGSFVGDRIGRVPFPR